MGEQERYYSCKINKINSMDFDNYEMKGREQESEARQERTREQQEVQEQAEQETNFDDFEDVIVDLKNLEQRQAETSTKVDMDLGGRCKPWK